MQADLATSQSDPRPNHVQGPHAAAVSACQRVVEQELSHRVGRFSQFAPSVTLQEVGQIGGDSSTTRVLKLGEEDKGITGTPVADLVLRPDWHFPTSGDENSPEGPYHLNIWKSISLLMRLCCFPILLVSDP